MEAWRNVTKDKTKLEKLSDLGLLGSIKVECHITGCKNLETTCVDCGRLVSTSEGVSGWINVKDRLPETYEDVLVFGTNGSISIDQVSNPKNGNMWACIAKELVVCWMPLPLPPKDE